MMSAITDLTDLSEPLLCQYPGCTEQAIKCVLPLAEVDEEPDYYCPEHAAKEGFCCCCGYFSAGMEGFDFRHPGRCDNCYDQEDHWEDDFDASEEWEGFYADAF